MKNYRIIFIGFLLISLTFALSPSKKESVIRIQVPYHDVVYQLQDKYNLSVIDAQDYHIDAYADVKMIQTLKNAGYQVTVLVDDYTKVNEKLPLIHTYQQVCDTMVWLRESYPNITKLETLGYSILNRPIMIMKVTADPMLPSSKPAVRLVGAHHGNEKISTEITLNFLNYLLSSYSTNPVVANLINTREIWICPILNVDGHVANVRYNNADVDINRDYGYMWQAGEGSPGPWSQPEPRLIQKHSQNNQIVLEYEYHSSASYVNYLWDYHPQDPPDSAYFIQISQEYADSTYGSSTTHLTKINGYDWYYVRGSAQDALFGIWGGIGTTIETPNPTVQAKVDSICIANRRALLAMITRAGWGISGTVRDSLTSQPLFAMIQFTAPKRWTVYTDKTVGDFHKMVAPGNYAFIVSANGYQSKAFNVTVPVNGVVDVDVELAPDTNNNYAVQKLIWVRRDQPDLAYRTVTMDGLGRPDFFYYSLGPGGTIVLEATPPIKNFTGNDFTVVEGDFTAENYSVSVSNDWRGYWFSCGSGSGTSQFDLTTASMDSARYIRIIDAGGSSTSDPYAGFDLDGIWYRQQQACICEDFSSPPAQLKTFSIQPNPARTFVNIKYQISNPEVKRSANQTLKIYNIHGSVIKTFNSNRNSENITWNTKDNLERLVPAGIYFCVLDMPQGKIQHKIIINR